MKNFQSVLMTCILTFVLFTFACQNQKPQWKGTITTENGVNIVQNPKQPMYEEDALVLEEDLSIRSSTKEGELLFSEIRSIAVDDSGNIFVLDEKEKHILAFDNTGKHLKTFGRAGQGPGEFSLPLTMGLTNGNEIVIEDYRNRLVCFSTEGEFLQNLPLGKTAVRRIILDSQGGILGIVIVRDEESSRYELNRYDENLNFLHTLGTAPTPSSNTEGFNPFSGSIYYRFDKDKRVVWATPDQYEIMICDTAGNLVKKITKLYDPVEITAEEKEEVAEEMPPEIKLAIPKHHNPLRWISTDDEGRIFVMTWERIPETDGYYHEVFDHEGRFLAKIPLEYRPHLIKKNNLYAVTEDEDGFHVVKRFKMTWRMDK